MEYDNSMGGKGDNMKTKNWRIRTPSGKFYRDNSGKIRYFTSEEQAIRFRTNKGWGQSYKIIAPEHEAIKEMTLDNLSNDMIQENGHNTGQRENLFSIPKVPRGVQEYVPLGYLADGTPEFVVARFSEEQLKEALDALREQGAVQIGIPMMRKG